MSEEVAAVAALIEAARWYHDGSGAFWSAVSDEEVGMLVAAGVTVEDAETALRRWLDSHARTRENWGFVRTVMWNVVLERRLILAGKPVLR